MRSIHGNFAVFRTKTPDGKNAIMLVPEGIDVGLTLSDNEGKDMSGDITFETVQGGENSPDSYLTVRYPGDETIHYGPYFFKVT